MSFWFRHKAKFSLLRDQLQASLQEVDALYRAAYKKVAEEERATTAAKYNAERHGPARGQLCTCYCEEVSCENCPNAVSARWEAEFAPPPPARPQAAAVRAAKRERQQAIRACVQVNVPESAEEADSEDDARHALRSFRKRGCFPVLAAAAAGAEASEAAIEATTREDNKT
jgi:hypothetical protein